MTKTDKSVETKAADVKTSSTKRSGKTYRVIADHGVNVREFDTVNAAVVAVLPNGFEFEGRRNKDFVKVVNLEVEGVDGLVTGYVLGANYILEEVAK